MATMYEKLKDRDIEMYRDARRTASVCQREGRVDLALAIHRALTMPDFLEAFYAAGSWLIKIGRSW